MSVDGDRPAVDWLALLRAHTHRFADVVDGADLGMRLRWCPDWSLRDFVVHLGDVHRWAAHAVVAGDPDLRPERVDLHGADLVAWYRDRAAALVDVLTATPVGAPAWTLDERDRTAGSWRRRQVHETAMHTWDAADALGTPHAMDPELAWDGVLEVAHVLHPRQVRLGRTGPLARPLRLAATDVRAEVLLGAGDGRGEPVLVEDRAEVLLRLLWHRADVRSRDPRAAAVLAGALTP
ncbi:maleylpyruvate isomerase family mycothiol-dependent enzyme [Nocardioides renjunii]|uniref:maleylpyruvate isomerase family mycothiol-dependent enzyme n=1 Tax=Nocardioides renjunii TaxID=3095075 RepID=UPI002AFEC482|nr:maleylpyruvate isomerase family mycothiol-dependent enzyme [Nocardioides sp. S-34]WQQ23960.1 maleylpyruvate isomerase family mycothiol-dependent enzyme [Nocardioides sp. S-34]